MSGRNAKRHRREQSAARIAAFYAAVQPTGNADPRRLGGAIVGPGGPLDRGGVVLDMTDCVLLDAMDVCTVDSIRDSRIDGQMIYMTLQGRVNKTRDRVQVGFTFGSDGAAALIVELLSLADRHGPQLLVDVTTRLTEMHRDRHVDLAWLRAAIDTAIDTQEGQ
jgi:hypothetical protein